MVNDLDSAIMWKTNYWSSGIVHTYLMVCLYTKSPLPEPSDKTKHKTTVLQLPLSTQVSFTQ